MKRRSDCPLSCGLEIFGDKWTLLIIRDMLKFGKQNYREFLASGESISTNILADRLKLLVEHGIIEKSPNPDNQLKINYSLTQKGRDLEPVILAIGKWSRTYVDGVLTELPEKP